MRDCLDEGILQSYFDGELSSQNMESATSHLASCLTCAATARELESENNLLATALAPEFDLPVPTESLRQRIDEAVRGLHVATPVAVESSTPSALRSWFQSLSELFTPQRALGYASLVAVLAFAAIFGVMQLRKPTVSTPPQVAANDKNPSPVPAPTSEVAFAPPTAGTKDLPPKRVVQPIGKKARPAGVAAVIGTKEQPANHVKLLPGERSYLKTIAVLDSTIKAPGNKPMRPALQAEYERNLALVDRALAVARDAAKKNPNDPDTAEFVYAAYQSKVDLLNTVADARLYNKDH